MTTQNLDLRQFLRPVWARRWAILAVVVLSTAATYVYFNRQPRQYRASTSVFVQSSQLDTALGTSSTYSDDRTTANQASLVLTSAVATRLARILGYSGSDPEALFGQLTVSPRSGQDFIDISAVDNDPKRAAQLANGLAQAFIETRSSQLRAKVRSAREAAQRELDATPVNDLTRETRADLSSRVRQLQVVESLPAGSAEQTDKANPPASAFKPQPQRNALFAALISLVLAIAAAFGLNRFDRRIRTLDDLESAYQLPLLGALPRVADAAPVVDGTPVITPLFREACRSLRTNIELAALDRELRTIVVVSGVSGEGKSTVLRNLALVYAEAGSRVVVVEGDVRRPTLTRYFGAKVRPGLSNVISGEATLAEVMTDVPVAEGEHGLQTDRTSDTELHESGVAVLQKMGRAGRIELLQSGPEPPNPPVLLGSERMLHLMMRLEEEFDIVLVDSAPLLVVSDAVPLITAADATVVVARVDETLWDAAKRMREVIGRVPDANPIGIVANQASAADVAGGYRYYSYSAPTRRGFLRRN